jgi:heptosyltransferase III
MIGASYQGNAGQSMDPRASKHVRTLVFRGGALGDFVLTLPLLSALTRDGHPPDLAALAPHRALALAGGLVGEPHRLDDRRWHALWSGGDLRAARAALAGVERVVVLRPVDPVEVGDRLISCGVDRVVIHDPRPPADGGVHAADHLLSAVTHEPHHAVPMLDLPRPAVRAAREQLEALVGHDRPRVLLMPGAGGERKRWPLTRFSGLAAALRAEGLGVVWILGPVEADRLRGRTHALQPSVAGAGPVQTAALCAACDVVVGNDTGTSHLAAATGSPVVALFGPTAASTWAPRGRGAVRVLRAPLHPDGDPCAEGCGPSRPARCMAAIQPADVLAATLELAASEGAG